MKIADILFKQSLLLIMIIMLSGCDAKAGPSPISQSVDKDTIWVSFQFNTPLKEGVEDYYYSARVSRELYDGIVDGKVTEGLIVLRDVTYTNNDDEIVRYEDYLDEGTLSFRLKDLIKMRLLKGDPMKLKDPEQESPTE